MKRPSNAKRRRQTQKRATPPAQITVSDRLLAGAAILVSGKDGGPDALVTELFLAWSSVRVLEDVMLDHARDFARRARAEGRAEETCAALCAVRRTQEIFYPQRRALMQAMATAPADTLRGLALKLLVWRWEASHSLDGALTDLEEIAAYSAYCDALKGADLLSLAHPRDALTDALLEAGKALEIDDCADSDVDRPPIPT
jgi:hypothetical protein